MPPQEVIDYLGQWPLVFFALLGAVGAAVLIWKIYSIIMASQKSVMQEQRDWQTAQNVEWRTFLEKAQQRADESARQNNEVQRELIKQINGLTIAIEKHDNFTRAKMERYDDAVGALIERDKRKAAQ